MSTSRIMVANRITIKRDSYGQYDSLISADTNEGMVHGLVKASETNGMGLGTHIGRFLIQVYETIYGKKLVERIVPEVGLASLAIDTLCKVGAREALSERSE